MHEVTGVVQLSWLLAQSCVNVVDCKAFSVRPPELYLIMEWYPMGNLLQVTLASQGTLSLSESLFTYSHTHYHLYLCVLL